MLRLFNTLSKKSEVFEPVNPSVVNIFTCGPSVYQRSHIGNFRTFVFEDILVRYLEYLGYRVTRGMNFTDVEDKALEEAGKNGRTLEDLTRENIGRFMEEMRLLKMKVPEYLPRASENIDGAVAIIEQLLALKIAYRYKGNIYFDPLKYPRFGELYGLDMREWPSEKRRFHKDTYPGMRWNLGDFILWIGGKRAGSVYWETPIGKGRPSWNIQDASIVFKHVHETLSIYCGGIDNLFRHHDYTRAILESVRPYPMAKYWLHGELLVVDGEKMSKSRGNIIYTDRVLNHGYGIDALRFFLLYCPYRKRLNYSGETMAAAAEKLRRFKENVKEIESRGEQAKPDEQSAGKIRDLFMEKMDDNLKTKEAFDGLYDLLSKIDMGRLEAGVASGYRKALHEIDDVLRVIF
jgi:cysteinyl-tRNA synthetase